MQTTARQDFDRMNASRGDIYDAQMCDSYKDLVTGFGKDKRVSAASYARWEKKQRNIARNKIL